MHRLPHKSAIWRLRLASVLLWLSVFAALAVVANFFIAFKERSQDRVEIAIITLIVFVSISIIQWLVSLRTKCPLCMTPVLAPKNCSKNRNAKTFLGSYRLRVANSVIFSKHFRCPYCWEPTQMAVRERGQSRRRGA